METDEVLNPKGDSVLELDKILDILNYDDSLNHLYDENSKYEVQQALTSMGFEELISTFEVEKIDYTVFISMDDQFIYGILKRFPWGIRKKFAIEYEKWLKNQNDQQMSVCHSSSRNNQKIDEESLSLMFREDPEAKEFYELHLNDVSPLPLSEKRRLVGIIINYFVDKKITLSKKDILILSKSIETLFFGESAQEYCNDKSGLLYNKSKNIINKYRKIGALDAPRKKKIKLDDVLEEKEEFSRNEIDADSYIKINAMQPLNDIFPLWESSFRIRRHYIMNMCKNSGVKEICELYKSFVRSDGWLLINSDFDKLHPGSNFLPKWTSMKNDLLEVLKLNVTNIAIKENLKMSHEMDDDSKSVAIIKGIHAFLYSAGMRTDPSGSKGKKIKDTIQDSIKTMYIQCPNESSLDLEIVKIRSFYEGKGYTFQPVIIGFDYNQANTKRYFLVHFEDNYYRLESFDKALEVLLKTYYIMDLKFPVSSQSIFSFLSAFFLDVQAEISPKVKSLINLLQSKLI